MLGQLAHIEEAVPKFVGPLSTTARLLRELGMSICDGKLLMDGFDDLPLAGDTDGERGITTFANRYDW